MKTVWRDLSPDEAVLLPEARLGGALAGLVVCAGALTLMGVGLLVFATYLFGPVRFLPELLWGLFDTLSPARRVGVIYAAHSVGLLAWSTLFFVMTLARASATPIVASVAFGVHFLSGVLAAIATQLITTNGAVDVMATTLVSFVPMWLGGLMMTVGFSAYLIGGVRPNAYYRRRIAVVE